MWSRQVEEVFDFLDQLGQDRQRVGLQEKLEEVLLPQKDRF